MAPLVVFYYKKICGVLAGTFRRYLTAKFTPTGYIVSVFSVYVVFILLRDLAVN